MTRVSTAIKQRFLTPPVQGIGLQILLAGVAGLVLGLLGTALFSLSEKLVPLFVLALLFFLLVMVIENVRKLFLVFIIIDIPFHIDIHFGYQEVLSKNLVASYLTFPGWDISVTTISLIILYALWLAEFLSKQGSPPPLLFRKSFPLICYLGFTVLSALVAYDIRFSAVEIFLLLQMFLVYLYVVSTVRTREEVLFVVSVLLICAVFEFAIMIGTRLTGQDFTFATLTTNAMPSYAEGAWQHERVSGTIGTPNPAANYVNMIILMAMGILLTQLKLLYKWMAACVFCLGVVALIFTGSRGGLIAFAVGVVFLSVSAWRRGLLSLALPGMIVILGIFVVVSLPSDIFIRFMEEDRGSAYSRVPLMKLAFRMITGNPLLGVGANNFALRIEDYITWGLVGEWIYTVHNKYLLIWAETGIGGLLAFLWFLGATIRRGWQCGKYADRFFSPIALGLTAAIIGLTVTMLVDIFNSRTELQQLFLFAGLITALYAMKDNGEIHMNPRSAFGGSDEKSISHAEISV